MYQGCNDQYFGHVTYSQHGEDLLFASVFKTLEIEKPTYLDIGANHPFNISNTALFYERGSTGINVDANPNVIFEFLKHRKEDKNINVGVSDKPGVLPFYMFDMTSGLNSFDKMRVDELIKSDPRLKIREVKNINIVTINDILYEHFQGNCPDLLSIDVEGLDEKIIKSMDLDSWRPVIICLEMWQYEVGDIVDYLNNKGYDVLCRMGANLIFLQFMDLERIRT